MPEAAQFHTSLHKTRSRSICYMVWFMRATPPGVKDRFTFPFDLSKFCNFKVTCLKIFTSVFKSTMKIRDMVACHEEGNYSPSISTCVLPIKSVLTW